MKHFTVLLSVVLAGSLVSAAPAPAPHDMGDSQLGDFDWMNWFVRPGVRTVSHSHTHSHHRSHKWHTRTRTHTIPAPTSTSTVNSATSATPAPAPEPTSSAEASSAIQTSSAAPETSSALPATSTVPSTTSAVPVTTPAPTTTSKPATTTQPTTLQASSSNANIDAYLKGHNDIRAQHGAKPLTWADDLAAAAAKWAGKCVWQHSQGQVGNFGENLAAGTNLGAAAAVKMWTNEASEYDPANPQYSHFTQVVWKATSEVGCAVTSCTGLLSGYSGAVNFHVCEYRAPGNVIGQFAQNVQV